MTTKHYLEHGRLTTPPADCLHCVVAQLIEDWLNRERIDPLEALFRLAEVLGGLIGSFPPAQQAALLADAQQIIAKFAAEQTQAVALHLQAAAGRA